MAAPPSDERDSRQMLEEVVREGFYRQVWVGLGIGSWHPLVVTRSKGTGNTPI